MPAALFALFPLLLAQDPAAAAPAAAAPPRIEWQRTLADALAVQQATGRPLLICVNQDGEPFSDRFATETYADPAFVALTRGYVCVLASPDRHDESDYDGLGRRIECPRFPGLTCSEHIGIEPRLYERWFHGQRTAPRHLAVGPDGKVLFDRFLDREMQTAIDAVKEHMGKPADEAPPYDLEALFARRDAASRQALEERYRRGDRQGRLLLLQRAAAATDEPFDLLRMGLRADDEPLFAAAAGALAAVATKDALIDLEDALARCDDDALASKLLQAVDRLAAGDAAAAQFAAHRRAALAGLERAARAPFAAVSPASAPAAAAPRDRDALEGDLDAAERAAKQAPGPASWMAVAMANLALARRLAQDGSSMVPMLYEDARRAAERAAKGIAGEPGEAGGQAEAEAVLAVARWQQGDRDRARAHAQAALRAAGLPGARCDLAAPLFGELLGVAARAAAAAAHAAVASDPTAVAGADVEEAACAFGALARHPAVTEADLREAAALLAFAGARRPAQELLLRAIERLPSSRELHQDYRARLAADRGAAALRARYAAYVQQAADRPTAEWFAGYAAIVAAELCVKDKRHDEAEAAYGDAIERLRRSGEQNPDYADSAHHFAVLALAGRALLRHGRGDGDGAVADLLAARALRPASMTESDGLGRKPDAILRRVARELREQGKGDLAARLSAGQ